MIRNVMAALAMGTSIVAIASPAAAQDHAFQIPAGALTKALNAYAGQSGRQVMFKADEVQHVRSPGTRGLMSADAALDAILAGTGFSARVDSSGAIAIVRSESQRARTPALTQQAEQPPAEKSVERTDIVVTATRSSKAIDKIPGAVSVISTKEVAQQFQIADDPAAALAATVPGFSPSRQKLSSAGESIRGRNALILLDGIPQGNPLRDGRREGYFLDSALIRRIEVVSGASAIYGLGATGGIVNYITKVAESGTHVQTDVRGATAFREDNFDWKAGVTVTHKSDLLDFVAYAGYDKRAMLYDAKGMRLGVTPAVDDTMDAHSTNLFLKVGKDFGNQRVEFTANRFRVIGEGDYIPVNGKPLQFIPTGSIRGTYAAGVVPYNRIFTKNLTYNNSNLFNGSLTIQLFTHSSDVLFGPEPSNTFQDPALAPVGTLVDQGLLIDRKKGGKLTYVRPNLFMDGFELTLGIDQLFDETDQNMLLTNRVWLTPLKYQSTAPFSQLELDRGDITIRGGLRYESGNLKVDDYLRRRTGTVRNC